VDGPRLGGGETPKPRGLTRRRASPPDLDIREACLVFEGTAREACRAFPANVNVVAAVSLAGLGPDRTRVRIYADPAVSRNRHTVLAEGPFGRLRIEIENVPSENPRTGKLSYHSTSRTCATSGPRSASAPDGTSAQASSAGPVAALLRG
jgi:predicted dinucleotide-utilizing enzyme